MREPKILFHTLLLNVCCLSLPWLIFALDFPVWLSCLGVVLLANHFYLENRGPRDIKLFVLAVLPVVPFLLLYVHQYSSTLFIWSSYGRFFGGLFCLFIALSILYLRLMKAKGRSWPWFVTGLIVTGSTSLFFFVYLIVYMGIMDFSNPNFFENQVHMNETSQDIIMNTFSGNFSGVAMLFVAIPLNLMFALLNLIPKRKDVL